MAGRRSTRCQAVSGHWALTTAVAGWANCVSRGGPTNETPSTTTSEETKIAMLVSNAGIGGGRRGDGGGRPGGGNGGGVYGGTGGAAGGGAVTKARLTVGVEAETTVTPSREDARLMSVEKASI